MAAPPVETESFNLQASISQTYDALANKIVNSLPEILGAIALVLIGWLVAYLVRLAVVKLINGLDSILHPSLRLEWLRSNSLRFSYAALLGRVAFWAVMLFFIASAANLVGWSLFTDWTQSVVRFLPQLITGLIIIFAGVLLGSGVKTVATRTAASAKLQKPELIGRVCQLAVIFTMAVIGVEQLGINVHFLTESLVVIVGVFLAGGALAFGLGSRALTANVIGAQNCRKTCRIGQEISITGVTGTVVEITSTAIILETTTGQAVVPASLFDENISLITSKSPAPTAPSSPSSTPSA